MGAALGLTLDGVRLEPPPDPDDPRTRDVYARDNRPAAPPPPVLDRLWRWAREHDGGLWLSSPPPSMAMLLTLAEDDSPILPRGRVGMLAAGGGIGKSWLLTLLALAVAIGRHWLDTFRVAAPGRVLLALAEEEIGEIRRRLYYGAELMKLDRDERDLALTRILPLPLAGVSVALTHAGGEETDFCRELGARLAETEWSLLVLDPLARFGGADVEIDNAAATRLVEALERLTQRTPGNPTLLVAHHTTKASRRGASDASAARGSSALTDAVRWQVALDPVMSAENPPAQIAGCVELRITKTNYGRYLDAPLLLVRDREHHGALRMADAAERRDVEGRRARPKASRSSGPTAPAAARDAVATLKAAGRRMNGRELVKTMGVKMADEAKYAGIDRAVGLGAIRIEWEGGKPGRGVPKWHHFVSDLPEDEEP